MKQKTQSSLARVADKGMILPFQPLAMTFHHVNYAVDMPKVRKITLRACASVGIGQGVKLRLWIAQIAS
jgi:hypothetical protein